jgi:hypothetical protein
LFELEIEPRARLAEVLLPLGAVQCHACGRRGGILPEEIVIERSTVPRGLDVFRVRDFTTLILVTEKFVQAAIALELTDILTREVNVEDH